MSRGINGENENAQSSKRYLRGDSNPGSLDCESGILPLSYRAPSTHVTLTEFFAKSCSLMNIVDYNILRFHLAYEHICRHFSYSYEVFISSLNDIVRLALYNCLLASVAGHVASRMGHLQDGLSWVASMCGVTHRLIYYPVYTSTFNPERNRFRSHASVYTITFNPDQRFDPD